MSLLDAIRPKLPPPAPPHEPEPKPLSANKAFYLSGEGGEGGTVLVFATTSKLARVAAWRSEYKDCLLEWCGGDWRGGMRVLVCREEVDHLRDPELEEEGLPYVAGEVEVE